ncbi:MAG: hypothetical protein II369_03250, partial [Clostridia bacterium]|nr:hypothetical protein [Clostridia bacterium]
VHRACKDELIKQKKTLTVVRASSISFLANKLQAEASAVKATARFGFFQKNPLFLNKRLHFEMQYGIMFPTI